MGIKFKDKVSVGIPVGGDVPEREILLDLKDGSIYSSTDGADLIKLGGDEVGGILHDPASVSYSIGDMVNLDGSSFIYVCKAAHVSTVACNVAPDDASWYQPGPAAIPTLEYNFISTDMLGAVPPALPLTVHAHEHDGLTGTPDQNGQYYFSVKIGSIAKTAVVYVDGFKLRPDEYDTTTVDGYVYIYSPVSSNSWVQIIV